MPWRTAIGGKAISLLHSRHRVIICAMKALILILLAATYAAAQSPTIADIAREERAKRAGNTSTRVYTTADIKTKGSADSDGAAPAAPAAPAQASAPAAQTLPPAADGTPTAEAPEKDPVKEWMAQTDKLRQETRLLLDQEAGTQLEISATLNRVNAPVTSQPEKDRALADLGVAQSRLGIIREQLTKKRSELQARELEGPPKPDTQPKK